MRGVREAPEVQVAVDDAKEQWARADHAWDACTWALVRDPTVGEPLSEGGNVRAFAYDGARATDMPDIMVLYDFDDRYVTIRSVRFSPSKHPYAGTA